MTTATKTETYTLTYWTQSDTTRRVWGTEDGGEPVLSDCPVSAIDAFAAFLAGIVGGTVDDSCGGMLVITQTNDGEPAAYDLAGNLRNGTETTYLYKTHYAE